MNFRYLLTLFVITINIFYSPVFATDIPTPLKPWQEWVLHGSEDHLCPVHFDNGTVRRCWWPSHLAMDVSNQGGLFSQQVAVYSPSWVPLPGNETHWPESVTVDGQGIPVTRRNNLPVIRMEPGDWQITGAFIWEALPEMLQVPATTGILSLTVNGLEIEEPDIDSHGHLSLNKQTGATHREDTMTATLFRLIEDELPMRVTTRVMLRVSGRTRQIRLNGLFPDGNTVMNLESPLPTRMASPNDLLVHARPGNWDIRITTRLPGPVKELSMGKGQFGEEIWSFKAVNRLRMVRITGAPAVEPSRTRMPEEWKMYPAYRIPPGGSLSFKTIRRGDPDPAPNRLRLKRSWWLDFDGSGFTVHDRIDGTLSRTWHLAMPSPMKLGRVAVDGEDQLITLQGDKPSPGVQLRRGKLFLEADSRLLRTSSSLLAVGWDSDFEQFNGILHLPPGWTLFSASNVDIPPGAWLQQWSLLDLFLVLIISISAYKLRNRLTGLIALVTLALIFHEQGAPSQIWLLLLSMAALLKYCPGGWFKTLLRPCWIAVVVSLIVISLPFMVQQIRTALYPQLEKIEKIGHARMEAFDEVGAIQTKMAALPAKATVGKRKQKTTGGTQFFDRVKKTRKKAFASDPDALVQTGPGLPTWQWKSVYLNWNGPVDRMHQIRLWLISPGVNLFLGLLRVILLGLLIVLMVEPKKWRMRLPKPLTIGTPPLIAIIILFFPFQNLQAETIGDAFPPKPLLEELKQRLLEPPVCLPHCADVHRLEMSATPDQLRLIMKVHALTKTAVPLPVALETWRPDQVSIDNEPAKGLARDNRGNLWIAVPKGIHQIKMTGIIGKTDEIRIAFPISPHAGSYAGVGWNARGFRADGRMDATVVLTRMQRSHPLLEKTSITDIPAFFHVTRTIRLGIQWEVDTYIKRVTAAKDPVLLSVPLLEDASLTTAGIQVEENTAQIPMGPEKMESRFSTTIPVSSKIRLKAPTDVPWTETWILDAATIWQCTLSGLTVVHHQDTERSWQPKWRPWPGERATIHVTRPNPVPGKTITIDSASLALTPGKRITRGDLELHIRSSKGGEHQIELPNQINLQQVSTNGNKLPIRQDKGLVTIPLTPGKQVVKIRWHQLTDTINLIRAPDVNVGDSAVNAAVSIHMPDHRWILFTGGPRFGPAVLFWSYGIVVVFVAFCLGKTDLTPLRTHQWILLGLGLTQVPSIVAVLVAGWLLFLGYRNKADAPRTAIVFNLTQLLTVIITLAALAGLYIAIERGLLGIPDMQIAGNHSTRFQLNWTQDRIEEIMPVPWVASQPMWVYRVLMLAWSLWLAFSLVSWLKWGWSCFSKENIWKPIRWARKAKLPRKEDP